MDKDPQRQSIAEANQEVRKEEKTGENRKNKPRDKQARESAGTIVEENRELREGETGKKRRD